MYKVERTQHLQVVREDGTRYDYSYDAVGQLINAEKGQSRNLVILLRGHGARFPLCGKRGRKGVSPV